MVLREEMLEIVDGLVGLAGGGINLNTIASGNNHILLHGRKAVDLGEGVFHLFLRKGQALPDLDRSGIVIQSDNNKFHKTNETKG
jgi:hypothetical protein